MIVEILTGQIRFLDLLIWFASLIITITIHEFAHAWAAVQLGDPTPKNHKRLTLNPLQHLDILGTIMLLLFSFGWGKPTPINSKNFKNPLQDSALAALAGPGINIIFAVLLGIVYRISNSYVLLLPTALNINIAIFNLLPIYPLDGEKIISWILEYPLNYQIKQFQKEYGMYILLFLMVPISGAPLILRILTPLVQTLFFVITGRRAVF